MITFVTADNQPAVRAGLQMCGWPLFAVGSGAQAHPC